MNLSIVIPAYNEENRIEPTILKTIEYLEKHFENYEIIVVDDGSKDNTVEVASKYKDKNVKVISNTKNRGKGFSVKLGVINAKYNPVLFMDSDMSTPISEVSKFMNYINEYDLVIGSRSSKDSKIIIQQPRFRKALGNTFSKITNLVLGIGISDTQCGFKLVKLDAARKIFPRQTLRGFAFDVELLFIAKFLGFKIKEVPVMWENNSNSKVSPIKDSVRMFKDLIKIRYNYFRKRYD
jgi:dolichyl-phosphate beta-glucosyltransferase